MTNYTQKDIKVGLKINCNGFQGTVIEIHHGQLKGMIDVYLDSGTVTVSASEVLRFQNQTNQSKGNSYERS
jgi:hypothetical protein